MLTKRAKYIRPFSRSHHLDEGFVGVTLHYYETVPGKPALASLEWFVTHEGEQQDIPVDEGHVALLPNTCLADCVIVAEAEFADLLGKWRKALTTAYPETVDDVLNPDPDES